MRRWLPPFDQETPIRSESELLSQSITAICTNPKAKIEEQGEVKPKADRIAGKTTIPNMEGWIRNYDFTGPTKSEKFASLGVATYKKFGDQAKNYAGLIDELTGGKYGERATEEMERLLEKFPDREEHSFISQRTLPPKLKIVSPNSANEEEDERSWLNASEQDLTIISPKAWELLKQHNEDNEPYLFKFGGRLSRLELDGEKWSISNLDFQTLRHEMARSAYWYTSKKKLDKETGEETVVYFSAIPPKHVIEDMLSHQPHKMPVPILSRLVQTPVFDANGNLVNKPGYHTSSEIYYHPAKGLAVPEVPLKPTQEDLATAKKLILEELLGDFAFETNAEKANAVCVLLEPFARELILGQTPLRMIEAPTPGSGKGLLLKVLTLPATGELGIITQTTDEEEWRKRITSQLKESSPVIVIDNINKHLASGTLCGALTTPIWSDRILGQNAYPRFSNKALWIATANNPTMSTEIARRTVRIRLDTKLPQPWLKDTGFKHEDLEVWAKNNRSRLVWAALILVQDWIANGKPSPSNKRTLGSFEDWCKVMGGILDNAGIEGFLGNLQEFYEVADQETEVWSAFLQVWWDSKGKAEVTSKDLLPLVQHIEGIDLGQGNERSQQCKFGIHIGKLRDRVIGNFRVVNTRSVNRIAQWQLQQIDTGV